MVEIYKDPDASNESKYILMNSWDSVQKNHRCDTFSNFSNKSNAHIEMYS